MDNAKKVAEETLSSAGSTAQQALSSKTYFYPIQGLLYLFRHPSLWPPVLSQMVPCIALSIAIILPMFFFTYIPQAAVLTLLNGPMGPINAIALVLSESATLINLIAKAFLLEKALVDVFDATLVCEGRTELVSRGRELKSGEGREGAAKLGRFLIRPLQGFSPSRIIQYIITLPLNFIPIVGTAVFLVLQGQKSGPEYHSRYFQLKGWTRERRDGYVQTHKGAYIAFGTTAMVMNLIPFASIFFTFSSTVGAALWASRIEEKGS